MDWTVSKHWRLKNLKVSYFCYYYVDFIMFYVKKKTSAVAINYSVEENTILVVEL